MTLADDHIVIVEVFIVITYLTLKTRIRIRIKGYLPDWDYMRNYIIAIEKIVVSDVVSFKNEMIK